MTKDPDNTQKYKVELIVIIALMVIVGAFIAFQVFPQL